MTDFFLKKKLLLHKSHYKNEIFTGFLSFARKLGDKHDKKLMDTATKTGIDAERTASKRVVQKTAEATEDLTGNKIPDKITSIGKSKNKQKRMK